MDKWWKHPNQPPQAVMEQALESIKGSAIGVVIHLQVFKHDRFLGHSLTGAGLKHNDAECSVDGPEHHHDPDANELIIGIAKMSAEAGAAILELIAEDKPQWQREIEELMN